MTEGHVLELEPVGEEERDWLLDGLAVLIRRQGFAPFVSSRLLLGRSQDFPDRVPKGAKGAQVLIRRLLHYAGMPSHRVRLQVYTEQNFSELDHRGIGHAGPGTAAWFAGIGGDVCEFGVNARGLRDLEALIGTLGHEVAHAFRFHHGLVVRDSPTEERLTDLTAVYLGFGMFLLNSSKVFKTGGYSESGERLLFESEERGYLAPRQIALLLAAQVVARELGGKARSALAAELAPNHRKLFEDACELLPPAAELRQRLGVPEPSEWPEAPDAPAAPLEPDDEEPEVVVPTEGVAAPRRTAHREDRSLGKAGVVVGGMLPLAGGALGFMDGWVLLGAAAAGAVAGFVVGVGVAGDACSACRGRLPRRVTSCPHCEASLVEKNHEDEGDLDDEPHDDEADAHADPSMPLMLAMYAAWAIQRDHVGPDAEESHTELIVALRCGQYPTERLAQAWEELAGGLKEPAASFIDDYFARREGPGSADYIRLVESGALRDTPACYARVADLLDTRLSAWSDASALRSL